ncbi:MAG: glycosyltransferase family 61 protein [Pseudomonadota bacterium]
MPEFSIAPDTIPAGRIVTARSYLVDRFSPDVEIIALPEKTRAGGTVTWTSGALTATPPPGPSRRRLLGKKPATQTAPDGRWILDMRLKSPENWAHFLNNHIPLSFGLAERSGRDIQQATLLLPKAVPQYILSAAQVFGLEVWATDDIVEGDGLAFDVAPWTAQRPERHTWVNLSGPRAVMAALDAEAPAKPLPRKVFLSRQDTRMLSNAAEIEALLGAMGFETVYPETLSPADQIRLIRGADDIVAIHSAGLAPLLYCDPDHRPGRLVELLPCGHMTDVYRAMAAEVGCDWIGVRGRIKPEYVRPAYQLDAPFKAYSLDNFSVDPVSVERAFDLLQG